MKRMFGRCAEKAMFETASQISSAHFFMTPSNDTLPWFLSLVMNVNQEVWCWPLDCYR